ELADVVGAAVNLATHAVQVNAVFHGEVDAEIVVLIAGNPALARSKSHGTHRFQAGEPGEDIDVVYMLFYNMISRQPFPVDPVTHHKLKIAPSRLTVAIPEHALVPIDRSSGDLTNGSTHDLFVGFHVTSLVVALRTGDHAQVLGLCLFGSLNDGAVSNGIHTDRFLQECMFVFFHRIF